jgi:signal transduction histidine kinase
MTGKYRGRLTVQGWLLAVLSVMGVVVLVGAAFAAFLLYRTDQVAEELSEDIQPARVAAYQLQAALRDQETALRGYLIAANPDFLEPYYAGIRSENEAAEDLRQRVGDREDLMADLAAIERAASLWRSEYAEPMIASVTPGRMAPVDFSRLETGKVEFDRLRGLFEAQSEHLTQTRAEGIEELTSAQTWRNRVLIGVLAVFLGTAALLAYLVRGAVTIPLAALAHAVRRITEGNFTERITPRGPKDIRAIASDVDEMRQRIVDELEVSRMAREALAQQAQALDEQAIELRRSNAELEQFAYVASHDLQEPLRKVASFCQLLEKRYGDKLDDRGHEYIKFAVDGAKRMQVLINDLLAFSRVGRLNSASGDVDLGASLDEAVGNVAAAIEESGAQVIRPEAPLPTVIGDRTLLTMLWQNLISNAVKFHRPDEAPRIVIGCEPDAQTDTWRLSVADNGIGIDKEFAEKVFVIFQRLHGRDTYAGTGIGLALCKKIVEYHGGGIWVDTSYTGGTRICFTLPITVDESVTATNEGTTV